MTWIIENEAFTKDEYYDSFLIEDVWHEDHRFENQILSRCHEEYSVDIFLQDGLYSVKVYIKCLKKFIILSHFLIDKHAVDDFKTTSVLTIK